MPIRSFVIIYDEIFINQRLKLFEKLPLKAFLRPQEETSHREFSFDDHEGVLVFGIC